MLGVEQSWADSPELTSQPPRQIFLTQSPVLASKVKSYYSSLVTTTATAKLTIKEAEAVAQAKTSKAQEDLEDLENAQSGMKGLPSRFSELTSQHYPLFISIDTLFQLLEADYDIDWGKKIQTAGHKQAFKRFSLAELNAQSGESHELVDQESGIDEERAYERIVAGDKPITGANLWNHYVDASVFQAWFSSFDDRLTKVMTPGFNRFKTC